MRHMGSWMRDAYSWWRLLDVPVGFTLLMGRLMSIWYKQANVKTRQMKSFASTEVTLSRIEKSH